MAWTRVLTCGLAVLLAGAAVSPAVSSAQAGEILFSIRDGRVTLVARDAQLSDILAVWEREGRTKIVARERVQGMVHSLELTNEPEAAALATVLRSVTGYIAAKYAVPPPDGSTYRCIIINPIPAPVMLAQAGPVDRGPQQPLRSPGMPPSMMGDPGMFPPAFVPPADDSDDSGVSRVQVPLGMRQPGMPSPTVPARPSLDPSAMPDPSTRPAQPIGTPAYPGAGIVVPGAAVPAIKPPGTPTQPTQRPPGID